MSEDIFGIPSHHQLKWQQHSSIALILEFAPPQHETVEVRKSTFLVYCLYINMGEYIDINHDLRVLYKGKLMNRQTGSGSTTHLIDGHRKQGTEVIKPRAFNQVEFVAIPQALNK